MGSGFENEISGSAMKIEIQVYKLKEGYWQIDIQKLSGGVLQYLDLCSSLLKLCSDD